MRGLVPASRDSSSTMARLDHGSGSFGRCHAEPTTPRPGAQHREALADVGKVRVAVHQVGVAEQRDPLARDDGGQHPVAERRGDARARAVVVRGTPAHDLDPPGLVGGPELVGHLEAHAPLAGVRMLRALLGERSSAGAAVRVDVVHVHEPRPGGLRGGEHGALQRREVLGPAVVHGVQGLVHGCRALRRARGERGIRRHRP